MAALGNTEAVRGVLGEVVAGPTKATVREFAGLLGKLSLHYWRPDFTPEQARHMNGDFVRLLDGCTADELRQACDEWVMDPLNRFYPTPGMLHELMRDRLSDRARMKAGAERLLELLDGPVEGNSGPLPSADEILRKHGKPPVMRASVPEPPRASNVVPISDALKSTKLANVSRENP